MDNKEETPYNAELFTGFQRLKDDSDEQIIGT